MNEERPIEKLLRRYAKKRRDEAGDPLAVHPATRRLLQGEVAAAYPKASRDSKSSETGFLALLVQRWAFALGVLVVLAITAAVLLPTLKSNNDGVLAQKKISEDLAVRESLAPMPAPATATPPAESQSSPLSLADNPRNQPASKPAGGGNYSQLRDESAALSFSTTNTVSAGSVSRFADAKTDADSLRESEESKRFSRSVSLDSAALANRALTPQSPARSAGEPVSADSLSLAGATSGRRSDPTDRYNETRQTVTPPSLAAAPSVVINTAIQDKNVLARGGGMEKDTERFYSQSFANVAPEPLRPKAKSEMPVVPVLAKFQIQQVGDQVRVIDADGSTYLGEMNKNFGVDSNVGGIGGKETAAYASEAAKQFGAQAPAGSATVNQQATQDYFWRVEGTNRTLNQNVVFKWNFVETTNNAVTTQINAANGVVSQDTSKLRLQFPALLNNSVINGRAQLGPAQQIEVNAVPVKP